MCNLEMQRERKPRRLRQRSPLHWAILGPVLLRSICVKLMETQQGELDASRVSPGPQGILQPRLALWNFMFGVHFCSKPARPKQYIRIDRYAPRHTLRSDPAACLTFPALHVCPPLARRAFVLSILRENAKQKGASSSSCKVGLSRTVDT